MKTYLVIFSNSSIKTTYTQADNSAHFRSKGEKEEGKIIIEVEENVGNFKTELWEEYGIDDFGGVIQYFLERHKQKVMPLMFNSFLIETDETPEKLVEDFRKQTYSKEKIIIAEVSNAFLSGFTTQENYVFNLLISKNKK